MEYGHSKAKADLIITFDDGREIHREVMQCCHCGRNWVIKPGSGRKRGWCFKCAAMTCGASTCDTCLPLEKKLGW